LIGGEPWPVNSRWYLQIVVADMGNAQQTPNAKGSSHHPDSGDDGEK